MQLAYSEAKAAYDRAVPNIDQLSTNIASLTNIFESINNLSVTQLNNNEKALEAFENYTVGTANASYSIWGDEQARLQYALSSFSSRNPYFSNYNVVRLPIHNIRLKKPSSSMVAGNINGDLIGDTTTKISTVGITNDSLILADGSQISPNPIFTKDNHSVAPEIKTLSGDGANTYINIVTRGTLCTGQTVKQKSLINTTMTSANRRVSSSFEVPRYVARSTNVLAQSVALEYDFYTKSEPLKVDCSLDVNKFRSFIGKSGSSGFLFWRKSWNKTERERVDQSGIACRLDLSPMGENPNYAEQKKYAESIQQAMMQEIAAEFVLTYAKSWEISQHQPAIPEVKNPGLRAGVALMALCGPNVYCAIGGIILKSGQELFGSNNGTASNQDYLSGTINRSYEESSWTVANGQAIIDLTVSI